MRSFTTHYIREQKELTGKLWDFKPIEGMHVDKTMQVLVPSCWETYPGFENFRGMCEYSTSFCGGGNIHLIFKGVSHKAWIYVDGKEIISHYNAYTPFDVILTNLEFGEHKLTIKVDNAFKEEYALNRPNDYMSYGGINRTVYMEVLPDIYIKRIHITPIAEVECGWRAHVKIIVDNLTDENEQIDIELKLHTNKKKWKQVNVYPGQHVIIDEEVLFHDVKSWMIESPNLYEAEVSIVDDGIVIDDYIDRVGFRVVSIKNDRILMNGKALRIKGFNRHEDHPQFASALPLSAMAYDLQLIKDLGANSIRTSHYPNDELFLDLCDELGILVWEEHHIRGANEKMMRNPYFEQYAEQVIEEMIVEHYNHPCIYIWGIMNECASETEYGRTCYEKQYALIRSLDRSRVCSSASCKFEKDLCMDLPDVASWNMYPYWYEDKTADEMVREVYNWTQEEGRGTGKPFLVTEIGAGAIFGFHSHDNDKWTEEYQAETLEKQLTEVINFEKCSGIYIWQFCDIRVSREWFEKRPRCRNNKGVVDEFRRRKLSYYVVKKIFSQLPNYWI